MWNSIINSVINTALSILKNFVPIMSTELRSLTRKFLLDLKKKAAETTNQWDDVLVEFLCDLFDVKG